MGWGFPLFIGEVTLSPQGISGVSERGLVLELLLECRKGCGSCSREGYLEIAIPLESSQGEVE